MSAPLLPQESSSTWDEIYYGPLSQTWGKPPWNIFMMVNILPPSNDTMSSKRTEIRIHSNPATIECVQNALYPSKKQMWKVIMIMGPFYDAKETLQLFNEWSSRSRGCKSRISIGINLFKAHKREKNLVLYITRKRRYELVYGVLPNQQKKGEPAALLLDCPNPIWTWSDPPTYQSRIANRTLEWITTQTNISTDVGAANDHM